mmetsp:Transcript_30498/g.84143  ORF Transcript_30498/g.84143 Transcript_30498/m.84143 type:complete len:231 (+) Transcript_30498:1546-2238(+)
MPAGPSRAHAAAGAAGTRVCSWPVSCVQATPLLPSWHLAHRGRRPWPRRPPQLQHQDRAAARRRPTAPASALVPPAPDAGARCQHGRWQRRRWATAWITGAPPPPGQCPGLRLRPSASCNLCSAPGQVVQWIQPLSRLGRRGKPGNFGRPCARLRSWSNGRRAVRRSRGISFGRWSVRLTMPSGSANLGWQAGVRLRPPVSLECAASVAGLSQRFPCRTTCCHYGAYLEI